MIAILTDPNPDLNPNIRLLAAISVVANQIYGCCPKGGETLGGAQTFSPPPWRYKPNKSPEAAKPQAQLDRPFSPKLDPKCSSRLATCELCEQLISSSLASEERYEQTKLAKRMQINNTKLCVTLVVDCAIKQWPPKIATNNGQILSSNEGSFCVHVFVSNQNENESEIAKKSWEKALYLPYRAMQMREKGSGRKLTSKQVVAYCSSST